MSTLIDSTPLDGDDGVTRVPSAYTDAEDALIDHLDWRLHVEDALDHAWGIVELMIRLGWRPVEELAPTAERSQA